MKYIARDERIPQDRRRELNDKILYLIDADLAEASGVSREDIYNAYTGDGGLHGLQRSDYDSYSDYPEINGRYEPSIYTYTYLLSPASTWASFGELEVVINTPFFITENSLEGFTKTDTGYTLKRNGLPEGELEFVLCSSENPIRPISPYFDTVWIVVGAIAAVIVIGGGIVAFMVVRKKKTEKEN